MIIEHFFSDLGREKFVLFLDKKKCVHVFRLHKKALTEKYMIGET